MRVGLCFMVFFITVLFRITAIFAVVSLSRKNGKGEIGLGYTGVPYLL